MVTNAEIAAANQRASLAEQECDVLKSKLSTLNNKLAEMENQMAEISSNSETTDRSMLKLVLWALLGIAVGIILGISCFNLFMNDSSHSLSGTKTEMLDSRSQTE